MVKLLAFSECKHIGINILREHRFGLPTKLRPAYNSSFAESVMTKKRILNYTW